MRKPERDRWFESISLHQRVMCEPDFQAVAAGFEGQRNPRETAAGPDRLIAPGQSSGGGIAFVNVEICGRYQEIEDAGQQEQSRGTDRQRA